MVLGLGGWSFLGIVVTLVALRDGGHLEPRTAGQPWYTGQRDGGVRRGERGLERRVDGGLVGLVDEVDLEAHDVVERQAGGAQLVGEVLERAVGLLGGRGAADRLRRASSGSCPETKTKCPDEMPGGRGAERARRQRRSDRVICSCRECSPAGGRQPRRSGAQTSRIFAARIAALRAPLMATQATGTPGGICTMLSSESRPPRSLVLIGTPITGRLV